MPAEELGCGLVPFGLGLEHVQGAGDYEAGAADDLRDPVGGVEHVLGLEVVVDAWEGGDSGDAEDGGAKELGGAGQEAQFVEIVGTEGVEGWEPLPGAGLWGWGCVRGRRGCLVVVVVWEYGLGAGSADQIVFVLVVVPTTSFTRCDTVSCSARTSRLPLMFIR